MRIVVDVCPCCQSSGWFTIAAVALDKAAFGRMQGMLFSWLFNCPFSCLFSCLQVCLDAILVPAAATAVPPAAGVAASLPVVMVDEAADAAVWDEDALLVAVV